MEGNTCDLAAGADRQRKIADLRWINAAIQLSSVRRISTEASAKRMTKRASATESFCSDADKLSATPDTT